MRDNGNRRRGRHRRAGEDRRAGAARIECAGAVDVLEYDAPAERLGLSTGAHRRNLLHELCIRRSGFPKPVRRIDVTAADASSVNVAWPSSRDNVAVAGYGVFLNGKTVGATPETRYTFGSLACGTGYLVGVDVYDAAGNRSQPTSTTVSTSACRDSVLRPTETIRLAASTETSVVLSWQASSHNIGVVGYGLDVGGFRVGSTSEPAATLTSLSCGRSYEVGVDAVDAAGNRPPARARTSRRRRAPATRPRRPSPTSWRSARRQRAASRCHGAPRPTTPVSRATGSIVARVGSAR